MATTKTSENPKFAQVPDYLKKVDAAGFDALQGEAFGGSSEVLKLEKVNEVAGPLTYVAFRANVDLGNGGKPVDMHIAKDEEGANWRLPIAADFRRQAESAQLAIGDVFYIKRIQDVIKKKGQGAGDPMEMYLVKVTERASRLQAA